MFCENYDQFVSELEKRNYTVHSAKDAAEAKAIALSLVGSSSVGCGGSVTVHSMGLPDAMREQGCAVYFHWEHEPQDRPAIFEKAAKADWYICSTNGITRKGQAGKYRRQRQPCSKHVLRPKKSNADNRQKQILRNRG